MSKTIDIIDEVQQNFIDSSYDTNTNRAFPNVADGLKPGQRAILWEMYTKKYTSNKPHVKSAKIDGGVAALWWPHGTTAIYETFARMSQSFSNNVPLVDFHGANGNIILGGDAIAADRYTEARLSALCEEGMLQGINKNNVDMQLNFSEDEEWPVLMPAIFPNLLVNGAQGIGVSVANVWLPHSFTETANLILKYIQEGILDEDNYYPDFPTGGTIVNKSDLPAINKTGKGKVIVQAKYRIEGQDIIFYEMPYQVYIEPVIEKIKEQIENGNLLGVSDVINKSDKKKIALVVECEKGQDPEKVLELLFATTPLQSQYNANQNGIISKTPILLTLQQVIDCYIEHNTKCIRREYKYDYNKAIARIEILEGLLIAVANIDKVIKIIRGTSTPKEELSKEFPQLTENQIKAILDMKLGRLSKLEENKLNDELQEKKEFAETCKKIVDSLEEQKKILVERLEDLVKKYGDERRTNVTQKEVKKISAGKSRTKAEEIPQDVVVTLDNGYIKVVPVAQYKKAKYFLGQEFKCTTKDLFLLFSDKGKSYRVSAKDTGLHTASDKGKACGAILKMEPGEKIIYACSSELNDKKPYITFVTNNGLVKKTAKNKLIGSTRNLGGVKCIGLADNFVFNVCESNGDILSIGTKQGYCLSFKLDEVRETGKTSKGIIGIKLSDGDSVSMTALNNMPSGSMIAKRAGKGKKLW